MATLCNMEPGVVVIGAGHAACQFAASLRQLGWKGALTLIGAVVIGIAAAFSFVTPLRTAHVTSR